MQTASSNPISVGEPTPPVSRLGLFFLFAGSGAAMFALLFFISSSLLTPPKHHRLANASEITGAPIRFKTARVVPPRTIEQAQVSELRRSGL